MRAKIEKQNRRRTWEYKFREKAAKKATQLKEKHGRPINTAQVQDGQLIQLKSIAYNSIQLHSKP